MITGNKGTTHRLLIAMLLALLTAIYAKPVAAHVELVSASPDIGSTVNSAPLEVRLQFSEPIQNGAIDLFGTGFTRIEGLMPIDSTESTVVAYRLPPLDDGSYTVNWKAVAEDGHLVSGSFEFGVDAAVEEAVDNGLGINLLVIAVSIVMLLVLAFVIFQKGKRHA